MSHNNSFIDTHFAQTVKIGKGRFIRTNFKKKKKEKLRKKVTAIFRGFGES